MKNNKYEVHVYAPTTSDKKEGRIVWQGDDRADAWSAFFYFIHQASLRQGDTYVMAYVLQLIEREKDGFLFVRSSFHYDIREADFGSYKENPNAFGWGMSMPRTKRDQLREVAQDVLLRFVSTFGLDPDDTITICETEPPIQYNWLEWFNNYYLTHSRIFI